MNFMTIALVVLAVVAIVASIINLGTDGYHRVRSAPIHRDPDPLSWH